MKQIPDAGEEMAGFYRFQFNVEVTGDDSCPEKYDTSINIKVFEMADEACDPCGDVLVGTGEAHLIHIEQWMNDGRPCSLEMLFDMEEEGIYWFWDHLFDKNVNDRSLLLSFRGDIVDNENLSSLSDVLIIHILSIDEEHRGRLLGLQVMTRTIEVFARASAVTVLKAFPLKPPDDDAALMRAIRGLQRYYRRIGFEKVGNDGFMICRPGSLRQLSRKRCRSTTKSKVKSNNSCPGAE